jgi:hypothetical protein
MADEWYYAQQGRQVGPVNTAYLSQLAASGQLQPTDLVWKEGMANWAPARAAAGHLFPEPAAVRSPLTAAEGYGLREAEPLAEPPTVYRRPQPDEGYYEVPRRRRAASGGNQVLAGIGITVALVLVIGAVILVIVLLQPGNPRSFNLSPNEKYTCNVEFKAGQKAQIWVTSDHDSDVDLFVYNSANQRVAFDDGPSKDCYVEFVPARTETFKIEVWNRILDPRMMQPHRNRSNRCTLKFQPLRWRAGRRWWAGGCR